MSAARDSLLKIKVVLDLANSLTNGGIELSSIELQYINSFIKEGLNNAQN